MNKCPFCGNIEIGYCKNPPGNHYNCGTWIYDGNIKERTIACYKEEIANLQEKLEAWREAGSFVHEDIKAYAGRVYDKLKDMGEI